MARLGDYVNIKTGKLDANAGNENGLYPFFTCSVNPLRINTYNYDCECVLFAGNGDLNVKYYNGKFNASCLRSFRIGIFNIGIISGSTTTMISHFAIENNCQNQKETGKTEY